MEILTKILEFIVNNKKTILIIVSALLLFLLGIYVGKKTTPEKINTVIEYVEGEPIHDTLDPIIIYEKAPIDTLKIIQQCVKDGIYAELFPEKIKYITDTLFFEKEDTTKILADWATLRQYDETLFDSDTLGVMKLKTYVQYNRLGNIVYDFTPMTKTVTNTVYKTRVFLPYIGAGLSRLPSYSLEGGFFIKQSWGFSLDVNYYPFANNLEGFPSIDYGIKILKMF